MQALNNVASYLLLGTGGLLCGGAATNYSSQEILAILTVVSENRSRPDAEVQWIYATYNYCFIKSAINQFNNMVPDIELL